MDLRGKRTAGCQHESREPGVLVRRLRSAFLLSPHARPSRRLIGRAGVAAADARLRVGCFEGGSSGRGRARIEDLGNSATTNDGLEDAGKREGAKGKTDGSHAAPARGVGAVGWRAGHDEAGAGAGDGDAG